MKLESNNITVSGNGKPARETGAQTEKITELPPYGNTEITALYAKIWFPKLTAPISTH